MISQFQHKESLNRQELKQRAQTIYDYPVGFFRLRKLVLVNWSYKMLLEN